VPALPGRVADSWVDESGGGGVTTHNLLNGRSAADAHPTSAITGLDAELAAFAADFVATAHGGREIVQTHGATGAAETIDVANGNVHVVTQDEACEYTFANPASATTACSFTLIMTAVTGAATWPASVNWPDGLAPTLTDRCILTFVTVDGGTTWDGFLAGSGLA
jgi:hypothetical protein